MGRVRGTEGQAASGPAKPTLQASSGHATGGDALSRPWWEYWMTEHTEPFALIDVVLNVFIYIVSFPHLVVLMCQISYHVFFFGGGGGITKVL